MNFYKHHIGDYLKKTAHLSIAEHGAYLLMLQTYYATEAPLPRGEALYRVLRATTKQERAAADAVLRQFWRETEEGYTNGRADEEIATARRQREVNRETGKRGGRPLKTNREETESVSESVSNTEPKWNPIQTPDSRLQTDIPNHPPSSSCVISTFPGAKIARAEDDERREIEALKAQYPPHSGRTDWITAEHHIRRQIERGATWQQMHEGVQRYVRLVTATNRMVLNPARFFGDSDAPWSQPWPLPPTKSVAAQNSNIAAAQAWLAGDGNAAQ